MRVSDELLDEFFDLCRVHAVSNAGMLAELMRVYTLYTGGLQVSPQTPLPSTKLSLFQESDLLSYEVCLGGEPDQVAVPQVKRSGTSTRPPRKSSQEKKITQAAKFSPESFALAQAFYDALEKREALPEQRGWFMRQVAYANGMLKSGNITLQDALQCLSWALADEWWGLHLTSINQLASKVWPIYQRKKGAGNRPPKWAAELMDWVDERNKED